MKLINNHLYISPSDIATYVWSPDDFYRRCVLGERSPETPAMLWGSLCHALMSDREYIEKLPLVPEWKNLLLTASADPDLVGMQPEVTYRQEFNIDDTLVHLGYRHDFWHPLTGKVIEVKCPQTAWTSYKVNTDIKNLCYRMFHDDVSLWCITSGSGIQKFNMTATKEKATEKVNEVIKEILGRLFTDFNPQLK